MTSKPETTNFNPYPSDWLNSDRLRYLYECILPLAPLLVESKLLDKLLASWIRHEIIREIDPQKNSELDEEMLLLQWCREQWGHRLESMYLENKNKLDLISYRILTIEDPNLAHELYYRLKGNEATFDELCIQYSIGHEKYKGGKFDNISLDNFPMPMQSAFKSMEVGGLHKPVKNGNAFVICQLLNYQPASLNESSEMRLLRLHLIDWQQGMINSVRHQLLLDD